MPLSIRKSNNMKKVHILLALSLLLGAIALSSCQREEPITPQAEDTTTPALTNYSELILGSWDAVLDKCYESYIEGDHDETTYVSEWANQLTLSFSDQGTLTYSADMGDYSDTWDDRYSIHSDTLVWDVKPYQILTLDEHNLIIQYKHSEQRTTSGGATFTSTVVKRYELTKAE